VTDDVGKNIYNFVAIAKENQEVVYAAAGWMFSPVWVLAGRLVEDGSFSHMELCHVSWKREEMWVGTLSPSPLHNT